MTETRPVVGWGGVPAGDSRRGLPLIALRATNRPQGWDTVKRTPPPSPVSPLCLCFSLSRSALSFPKALLRRPRTGNDVPEEQMAKDQVSREALDKGMTFTASSSWANEKKVRRGPGSPPFVGLARPWVLPHCISLNLPTTQGGATAPQHSPGAGPGQGGHPPSWDRVRPGAKQRTGLSGALLTLSNARARLLVRVEWKGWRV